MTTIPDEAVYAAARELARIDGVAWSASLQFARATYRKLATKTLEAAYPAIRKQVLDDVYEVLNCVSMTPRGRWMYLNEFCIMRDYDSLAELLAEELTAQEASE